MKLVNDNDVCVPVVALYTVLRQRHCNSAVVGLFSRRVQIVTRNMARGQICESIPFFYRWIKYTKNCCI
jgi:hypothetical protein